MKRAARDREIVRLRVQGASPFEIAQTLKCKVARVTEAVSRFADATIDERVQKNPLAIELARLDAMQRIFFDAAMNGDVASGALVEKLIARRANMLGLGVHHSTAEIKLIDVTPSKQTSTDKLEAVLRDLKEQAKQQADGDGAENEGSDLPVAH